jgi:pilus assembly protein Flp/PilA
MAKLLKLMRSDTSGATAIEYALIAGIVSIAFIVAATEVGARLIAVFEKVASAVPQP